MFFTSGKYNPKNVTTTREFSFQPNKKTREFDLSLGPRKSGSGCVAPRFGRALDGRKSKNQCVYQLFKVNDPVPTKITFSRRLVIFIEKFLMPFFVCSRWANSGPIYASSVLGLWRWGRTSGHVKGARLEIGYSTSRNLSSRSPDVNNTLPEQSKWLSNNPVNRSP